MTPVDRIGWVVFWFLAALGAVFGIVGLARADAPSLSDRIVAVQPSLASRTDTPVNSAELASAIIAVPRITREWAALLLTVAGHESALSARIAAGQCRPLECDRGKAFGLYQQHKNVFNADVWGSTDIRIQTIEAARALRSGFYTCHAIESGKLRADWVARTINGYSGHSCDASWPGLDARIATFKRIRSQL